MNFRKYLFSITSSVIVLGIPVSGMEQKTTLKQLKVYPFEVPEDVTAHYESASVKLLAAKALKDAGINEVVSNDDVKASGFGAVCFTQNYAIKISQAEYVFGYHPDKCYYLKANEKNRESIRLQDISDQQRTNPPAGMEFCLPKFIYQLVLKSGYKEDDSRDIYQGFNKVKRGYNIQISGRITPQADMGTVLKNCIQKGVEKDLKTIRCFGEKFGQFHKKGLIEGSYGSHDTTCVHGDMKYDNIFIKTINNTGDNATFIFIDNSDYQDGKYGSGKSLVTEPTYFMYKIAHWETPSVSNIEKTLMNFNIGYISQLKKETSYKLNLNFYQKSTGQYDGCYAQLRKEYVYAATFDPSVPKIQSSAFMKAYNYVHPAAPVKQPEPVFIMPKDFNAFIYIHMNGDLADCTKDMTPDKKISWSIEHYKKWGSKEEFRFHFPLGIFYISKYKDLYELYKNLPIEQKEREGRNHYKLWGSRPIEKRDFSFPTDFNGLSYINAFGDLKSHFSKYKNDEERAAQGLLHYVTYGYYEMNIAGTRQTLYNPKVNLYKK